MFSFRRATCARCSHATGDPLWRRPRTAHSTLKRRPEHMRANEPDGNDHKSRIQTKACTVDAAGRSSWQLLPARCPCGTMGPQGDVPRQHMTGLRGPQLHRAAWASDAARGYTRLWPTSWTLTLAAGFGARGRPGKSMKNAEKCAQLRRGPKTFLKMRQTLQQSNSGECSDGRKVIHECPMRGPGKAHGALHECSDHRHAGNSVAPLSPMLPGLAVQAVRRSIN